MESPERGLGPVRVTVKDQEETVSFLVEQGTLPRLVAACSISPASLGDLLVAADVYERGIAVHVMSELMEFDNAVRNQGLDHFRKTLKRARQRNELFERTFLVMDQLSRLEALRARGCPLVLFDLPERSICASDELGLTASGEVRIRDGEVTTDQTVSYFLPEGWSIEGP